MINLEKASKPLINIPYKKNSNTGCITSISKAFSECVDDAFANHSHFRDTCARAMLKISDENSPQKASAKNLPILLNSRKDPNSFLFWHQKTQSLINELPSEQKILRSNCSDAEMFKPDSIVYTANQYIHGKSGFTDNIYDCIVALLYNKDDAYMTHLYPGSYVEQEDIEFMQKCLEKFINNLQCGGQKCEATLIGGQMGRSEQLHLNILDVLSAKGICPDEIMYETSRKPHSVYYDVEKGIVLDKGLIDDRDSLEKLFARVNLA